jgi:GTP-binding protein HflX
LFFDRPERSENAVLVHVRFSRFEEADEIAEFVELVGSAGVVVDELITARRQEPQPKYFVGQGKLAEIGAALKSSGAGLVVFNHELGPGQQRNVEQDLHVRVLTRTQLILDIFSQRARTHEGQLQVELAQLNHAQTRLVRGWTHLDRQKGGIGLRGAGETQLELDKRMLSERIRVLDKRLGGVRRQREQSRRRRRRASVPTIALVGYTNVGKSSIFNRLTASELNAQDQLFATLDPTLRKLPLEGFGTTVLADTVGFIRDLPHSLVAAFKATLEEVAEADLLLHVVDANAPDLDERAAQVHSVLEEIGAADRPVLEVYNKVDTLDQPPRCELGVDGDPARVWISARTGAGVELLLDAMARRLGGQRQSLKVLLPFSSGRTRSWLYGLGAVLDEQLQEDGRVELTVRLDERAEARLRKVPGVLLQGARGTHRIAPSPLSRGTS